jgi:hypothetical protein
VGPESEYLIVKQNYRRQASPFSNSLTEAFVLFLQIDEKIEVLVAEMSAADPTS